VLLVFYALAACMWTVWLWMTGLKSVPAAQAGVFTVLLPISAALVGVLVLGERLGPAAADGLRRGAGRRAAGHLALGVER
jgi:drug/metabolite transporter (DMT)-like permease